MSSETTRPNVPADGLGKFRCQLCRREWKSQPDPQTCRCGHIWIDWLNYDLFLSVR